MTANQALQRAVEKLQKTGVDSPALDAELLLAQTLRKDRAWIFAHPEQHISRTAGQHFSKLIKRRAKREPMAYIVGHKEFYGLDFLVNRQVLIPRPETEVLVEQALEEIRKWKIENSGCVIVDVGTGSGAIAVALATGLRIKKEELIIFAIDNSRAALNVARRNAKRHGVERKIKFLQGNLLEPLKHDSTKTLEHFVIVANLPYLPTAEWRQTAPEVRLWEPRSALDGGRDGLRCYRQLFHQLKQYVPCSMLRVTCLCELCPHQVPPFKRMVRQYFKKAQFRVVTDLSGRARVIIVQI